MQRASGQYDHLARVPCTGPRQSCGRRSFAPRHWCRATPRRSRGMEPTVRSAWIKPAIGPDAARSSHLSRRFPSTGWSVPSRNPIARNGIFGCGDWRPRIHPRDRYCRQRPGTLKIGDKIPAETASFRSTTVSAVREDCMVVCAVRYEPVSLLLGQYQGDFRK
jgi:hypothetical protein